MSFLDLYEGDQAQAAKIQPNEGARLPTGFEQNFGAAWSDGRLFGQSIASQNARAAVLSDYASEVKQKTGFDLNSEQVPSGPEGGLEADFDRINARVAKMKESYPDLDLAPLSDQEIDKRAVAKAQGAHRDYEAMQAGEKGPGGSTGTFLGSAAASAADPVNILALAVAPETAGSVSILSAALRWGSLAGASQAAIEASSSAFKEQVQPGYAASGEAVSNVAGAFVSGAVLGGTTRALGNAWTRVKTGEWPTSVRDAGNVIESEAHVAETNPFPGVEGEVAHREALTKTVDDILANRPVSVDQIITPDLLERSRSLTEKLQGEQPMRLPVVNRRAIELAAEQERLTARDSELSTHLEQLPAGDASAADRLNRLQAVEQQIAQTTDPAALKKLGERRDQILVDTNPEALQAAAAPIEQRRVAEAERTSIAGRLEEITAEHTRLQADQALLGIKLPPLGEAERIPTGPKGQFEMDLQPPVEPVKAAPAPEPGPPAQMQTSEQMAKTLTEPAHQEAIRADIDRARALGDVQVPHTDEAGNHTMTSVDAAMDQVDAYKAAAEQIQACANPVQEGESMQPLQRDVTERGRGGRPIASEALPTLDPDTLIKARRYRQALDSGEITKPEFEGFMSALNPPDPLSRYREALKSGQITKSEFDGFKEALGKSSSPEPTSQNIYDTYQRLAEEQGGFSAVKIHDLIRETGVPKEAMHDWLLARTKAGDVTIHPSTSVDLPKEVMASGMRIPGYQEPFITTVMRPKAASAPPPKG